MKGTNERTGTHNEEEQPNTVQNQTTTYTGSDTNNSHGNIHTRFPWCPEGEECTNNTHGTTWHQLPS